MIFRQLFEAETSTYTYLLADPVSREAVLIDPVLDTIERDLALLRELGLELVYTLETHVHADHVTASGQLRERVGSKSVVSAVAGVGFQASPPAPPAASRPSAPPVPPGQAGCADVGVRDGDKLFFGDRWLEVRETPGHTNGCVSYVLDDHSMVFTGDALLIRGTGRADFQQGDPGKLYDSITTKLFTLPDDAKVFPGHDYRGHTSSTIAEEKAANPRIGGGRSREEFVAIMNGLELAQPKRIAEAVPANLGCGLVEPPSPELPVTRNQDGVPEIDGAWVAANPGVHIVDVRDFDEWSEGHIDGAELVPMAMVGTKTSEWSPAEPVVLVCRSGVRSGRVAKQLESSGFARVASLRGGILAWAKQGHRLAC